jgi:hypothetical protein
VFAHAFYHHRPEFDKFEVSCARPGSLCLTLAEQKETHLTARFKLFTTSFGLMTTRMFTPPIDP